MTTKEKRDLVLRDVFKPELKKAGYSIKKSMTWVSMRDSCFLAVLFDNGRFNYGDMGFDFGYTIEFFVGQYSPERLKGGRKRDYIGEAWLLPHMGFLHPYRRGLSYQIDGYKNYHPQDMDVEDLKHRIGEDLRQYILPELAQINSRDDWERKKQQWTQQCGTERIRLLRFFDYVHHLAADPVEVPIIINFLDELNLSTEAIRENYLLYQHIRAYSELPQKSNWTFLLTVLYRK